MQFFLSHQNRTTPDKQQVAQKQILYPARVAERKLLTVAPVTIKIEKRRTNKLRGVHSYENHIILTAL